MTKISKSTYEDIKRNISNPLSVMYDKIEKKGTVSFKDIQDEYSHMFQYIQKLEEEAEPDAPLRVTIDGREYVVSGE